MACVLPDHGDCRVMLWSTGSTHQNDLGTVYLRVWVVKMHLLGPQSQELEPLALRSGTPHF